MPIYTNNVTLGTAAVEVVSPEVVGQEVHLHNMTKSSNEYIYLGGGSDITTSNTIHIDPGESIQLQLGPGDALYALSDPDGLELGILVVKQD
jgi:hypothetical protein